MDYNMNEPKFNLTDIEYDFDVHTILGETKQEYERKLQIAQAKQPKAEW